MTEEGQYAQKFKSTKMSDFAKHNNTLKIKNRKKIKWTHVLAFSALPGRRRKGRGHGNSCQPEPEVVLSRAGHKSR